MCSAQNLLLRGTRLMKRGPKLVFGTNLKCRCRKLSQWLLLISCVQSLAPAMGLLSLKINHANTC